MSVDNTLVSTGETAVLIRAAEVWEATILDDHCNLHKGSQFKSFPCALPLHKLQWFCTSPIATCAGDVFPSTQWHKH